VLSAGDWAIGKDQVVFAPAAFSPAAYHLFAGVDPTYNWWYVLDTNYDLLSKATQARIGANRSAGLPPAYVGIDRESGALIATGRDLPKDASVFDASAARVYWRIALDARLHDDGRADTFLSASAFLHDEWRRKSELFSRYAHHGQPLARDESFTLYSAVLPKFAYGNQRFDDALYATKIATQYNARRDYALWGDGTSIAEQQLSWLAVGLYGQAINDDWSNKAPRITVIPVRPLHRSIAL
jgi:endoglucanase